jgi:LmbE family N-acetylglucosaminyl deacetylase
MQLLSKNDRALVLCAHTDDEFGCAGAVIRLLAAGAQVRYVALSRCEESVPQGFPIDCLETECRACTARLGINADEVSVFRFPVRHFPAYRQEILEALVHIRREYAPTIVLLPSSFDTHQDHKVVFEEGFRAFKQSTLLGYELPQNLISFSNSAFVELAEADVRLKVESLGEYRSQDFRPYASEKFIESLAHVRGVQCGMQYAEAYEVIRVVHRHNGP